MSKTGISITTLLSKAKYKHPEHTRTDLSQLLKHFRALVPRLERYTFDTGLSKDLIYIEGTIPVNFRDVTYNIPIGIFVSDRHPFEAPICYVRPTKDMMIKTSIHVDASGRVYMPYLSEWKPNTSDLMSAVQVMQIIFGSMCPVYKRVKNDSPTSNVAMPPALPTNNYYPFSSRGGPSNDPSTSTTPAMPQKPDSSGTITEEHIRASLLSAVEDRLKNRMREKVHSLSDQIELLKKTSSDLERGKAQLDEMKTRMANDISEVSSAKIKLQELNEQLQEFIVKYDKEDEKVDPDEVYGPTQPLFKQLLDAFAEENAIVDAIYYTGEGLRLGIITLDVFLKNVRELSRRQFMLRALMRACRTKASLPN